ncbi:MAG: class I SAM-dependent methyltransferase [Acidimicrobiales bacterium]
MGIDLDHQTPPRPPDRLIDRVTPGVRQQYAELDRQAFDASGQRSVRELEAALQAVGRELHDFARILDFGCGCNRVMRWLGPLAATTELHGCDIDRLAIEWSAEHLPFATFAASDAEPPLPYPDEHFDLIVNHSVLTHLDEPMQDGWLPELRRVLRPDGLALLSVNGTRAFNQTELAMRAGGTDPSALREALADRGIAFVSDDNWVGGSFPEFYHTTYHAPWYVFEHWSQWFDIRAYLPHGDLDYQDMVVVQRVGDDELPRPIAPRREVAGGAVEPEAVSRRTSVRALGVELARRTAIRVLRPPETVSSPPPPATGGTSEEMSPTVRSILGRMGERVTRLEEDVARLEGLVTPAPDRAPEAGGGA